MNIFQVLITHASAILMCLASTMPDPCHQILVIPATSLYGPVPMQKNPERPPTSYMHLFFSMKI